VASPRSFVRSPGRPSTKRSHFLLTNSGSSRKLCLSFHVAKIPISTSSFCQPHECKSFGLLFLSSSAGSTAPPSAFSTASIGISSHGSNNGGRCSKGKSHGLLGGSTTGSLAVAASSSPLDVHPDTTTQDATSTAAAALNFLTPSTTGRSDGRFHPIPLFSSSRRQHQTAGPRRTPAACTLAGPCRPDSGPGTSS